MKKDEFKHLQSLVIAQSTLLIALIDNMSDKGLIDSHEVMTAYKDNLKSMKEDLTKK